MSVEQYPEVVGEFDTVRKLLHGYSIARIGDGEVKLMTGGEQMREPRNDVLGGELRLVLRQPVRKCLPAILTMDPNGPKYPGLSRHAHRFLPHLHQEITYYSSLITRPDAAPWIDCVEYAQLMQRLWAGKRVALVCEHIDNKIAALVRLTAASVLHVPCPHRETYAVSMRIVVAVAEAAPEIAILSAGPAATCMAMRLSALGIQAIDIGSAGGFLLKLLEPKRSRSP